MFSVLHFFGVFSFNYGGSTFDVRPRPRSAEFLCDCFRWQSVSSKRHKERKGCGTNWFWICIILGFVCCFMGGNVQMVGEELEYRLRLLSRMTNYLSYLQLVICEGIRPTNHQVTSTYDCHKHRIRMTVFILTICNFDVL